MKFRTYIPLAALVCFLASCTTTSQTTDTADTAVIPPASLFCSPSDTHEQDWLDGTRVEKDLWQRIRDGFAIDADYDHPRIKTHLDYYARNKNYMSRVGSRGQRYLFHIVEHLEAQGLPLELALLPIVESAFDPFAYSHGRASGIWQFIPGTGKVYGLKQNWWYDGRRDVVAATEAAATYLKQLNKQFDGDWLLALAAYNTGQGNVRRAIRRNKQRGKPTDFWSLKLPKETRAYVPQLLALTKLIRNPENFDLELVELPNEPYFAEVAVGSQIDLAQAAELADISMDQLYALNAGFNRWATDPDGPHRLQIPVEKAEAFEEALRELPENQRIGWVRYRVKPGDSLIKLAKRYHTSVNSLKTVNKLRSNTITAGKALMIPTAMKPAGHYAFSSEQRTRRTQDRVSGGKGAQRISYSVKSGDTLWSISRRFKVKVGELARWNAMAPKDPLKTGQKLVIWTKDSAQVAASWNDPLIRKVGYRVRRGDSLARIASKFNVSIGDIVRWNTIRRNDLLHPGQRLSLFVDVRAVN